MIMYGLNQEKKRKKSENEEIEYHQNRHCIEGKNKYTEKIDENYPSRKTHN